MIQNCSQQTTILGTKWNTNGFQKSTWAQGSTFYAQRAGRMGLSFGGILETFPIKKSIKHRCKKRCRKTWLSIKKRHQRMLKSMPKRIQKQCQNWYRKRSGKSSKIMFRWRVNHWNSLENNCFLWFRRLHVRTVKVSKKHQKWNQNPSEIQWKIDTQIIEKREPKYVIQKCTGRREGFTGMGVPSQGCEIRDTRCGEVVRCNETFDTRYLAIVVSVDPLILGRFLVDPCGLYYCDPIVWLALKILILATAQGGFVSRVVSGVGGAMGGLSRAVKDSKKRGNKQRWSVVWHALSRWPGEFVCLFYIYVVFIFALRCLVCHGTPILSQRR